MMNKRENQYRDDLVDEMIKSQKECGLNNLIINCETQEKSNGVGLLDIKIQYRNLNTIDNVNNKYHTIECKRFGKKLNINDYYLKGILKFLNGKYSLNNNYSAIICFIEEFNEKESIEDVVRKINNYLIKKEKNTLSKNNEFPFDYVYHFEQKRNINDKKINIEHIMLDYSKIYSNN